VTVKSGTAKFYGNMDWFDIDDDINGVVFPPSFNQAKLLWTEDPEKNFDQVIKLIEPFVVAWFVPAALSNSEDIFPDQSDVRAAKIKVIGVDFSTEPFPLCKAEAWFIVPVSDFFSKLDVEAWQDDTGEYFHQAISFGWEIPSDDGGDSLLFTYGNNQGVDCVPNSNF
jgi:hypothetical protein